MFSLLLRTWPIFALLGVIVVPMLIGEALDYFFPGHGWMIVAYGIGAFGVGFIVYAHARN